MTFDGYKKLRNHVFGSRKPVSKSSRRFRPALDQVEGRTLLSGGLGPFTINSVNSGLYLDNNSSTANGASIVENPIQNTKNQQWDLSLVSGTNNIYNIVNDLSGKYLEVPGNSTSDGTGVVQQNPSGGLNQEWVFVSLGRNDYKIVNAYSGLLLGMNHPNPAVGDQVTQSHDESNYHEWVVNVVGQPSATPALTPTATSTSVPTGAVVTAISNAANGMSLDSVGLKASGAPIDQVVSFGGRNQPWDFIKLSDGNYNIINDLSGKYLENYSGANSDGVGMIQWDQGSGGSEWDLIKLSDGNYNIRNVVSGLYLDGVSSSASSGTQVIQNHSDGSQKQEWVLTLANGSPGNTPPTNNPSVVNLPAIYTVKIPPVVTHPMKKHPVVTRPSAAPPVAYLLQMLGPGVTPPPAIPPVANHPTANHLVVKSTPISHHHHHHRLVQHHHGFRSEKHGISEAKLGELD